MDTPQVPGDAGGQQPARRSRRPAVITGGVILLAILGCLAAWAWLSGFWSYWKSPAEWRGAPVQATTLEEQGWRRYLLGGGWRNLPFTISPAEERDVNRCERLLARAGAYVNGVNQFSDPAVKTELDAILKQRPKFFYGEYVLSCWWTMKGDQAEAGKWLNLACQQAPVVLVQPYRFADGRPATGLRITHMAVECNRVQNHKLDPHLHLEYRDLVTDEKGCVYLPAYNTVFRLFSASSPEGYGATYPTLGWFEVRGKVGVLPAATVTPAAGPTTTPVAGDGAGDVSSR